MRILAKFSWLFIAIFTVFIANYIYLSSDKDFVFYTNKEFYYVDAESKINIPLFCSEKDNMFTSDLIEYSLNSNYYNIKSKKETIKCEKTLNILNTNFYLFFLTLSLNLEAGVYPDAVLELEYEEKKYELNLGTIYKSIEKPISEGIELNELTKIIKIKEEKPDSTTMLGSVCEYEYLNNQIVLPLNELTHFYYYIILNYDNQKKIYFTYRKPNSQMEFYFESLSKGVEYARGY